MSAFIQRRARGLFVAAIAIAAVAGPTAASAATITVTTNIDALVTDGACSLREAIINANNDAATWPDCAAGSGDDTIVLPLTTISLAIANAPTDLDSDQQAATGDLDILSSMTIIGDPGTTVLGGTIVQAMQLDRVFDINPDPDGLPETPTPSITVHIKNLTMQLGRQNQAGGVRINARATVFMDNSVVANSTAWADDGGGIYVFPDGALTLTNSNLYHNSALLLDGGIKSEGSLVVVNSTIAYNFTSAVTPDRGQGLGCSGGPVCTIRNTIIADNRNTAIVPANPVTRGDIEGTITSLGYNVIGQTTDTMGNPLSTITATTGDQFDTGAAPIKLSFPALFGGPTLTIALGPGSIAIDAGHSSGASIDARGEPRPCDQAGMPNAPGGDGADIGAYEVQVPGCVPPNAPPDAVDDAAAFDVNSGLHTIGVLANDTDPDADALTITAVTQGAHGVVGNNGISVSYTPNANFVGTDTFTYTVDDGHSHTDTATVTVTVADTTAPTVTASTTASSLWPPNHQLEHVGLTVNASDNGGQAPAIQVTVFSDEDDLAPGSGNFSPDAKDIAPGTLRLRSERSGSGSGRVYLIIVKATDASNNASHACVAVTVPQSQSPAARAAIAAEAAAAVASCSASGAPPAGFVPVGDGPIAGPKQ